MGAILIVAEIQNGSIREASYELAGFAHKIADGRPIKSVVLGNNVEAEAKTFADSGGGDVILIDDELLANYSVDAYRQALKAVIDSTEVELVLISNTPSGWDVAPRLAVAFEAAFIADCFNIESDGEKFIFLRRIFNGKLDAQVVSTSKLVIATMQPGAAEPYEGSTKGSVTKFEVSFSDLKAKFLEIKVAEAKGVDLTKASIIVSGGRGLGAPEKFSEVIQPLADVLGGAMGASRPVVDAGWLPHEYQVGSSGQVVQPKLYIACGISGAIQHLVGMKNSNYIIAINKDADAPIFEVADLGVVGDLFEIVPALVKAVTESKS